MDKRVSAGEVGWARRGLGECVCMDKKVSAGEVGRVAEQVSERVINRPDRKQRSQWRPWRHYSFQGQWGTGYCRTRTQACPPEKAGGEGACMSTRTSLLVDLGQQPVSETVSAPVNVSQILAPRPSSRYAPSTW